MTSHFSTAASAQGFLCTLDWVTPTLTSRGMPSDIGLLFNEPSSALGVENVEGANLLLEGDDL